MTLMQESAGWQPRTDNGGTPMPLPTPHAGENRDDFVKRCMADPATQDITGADAEETQSRRVAACERQFDDRKAADEGGDAFGMKAMRDVTIGDETKGEVSAVISTFDEVDNDAEVIPTGAIPDGTKVTVSSYNHDTIMGHMFGTGVPDAPPVGKGVIRTMGNKAVAQLNYFMETQRGREAFNTVKAMGADQAWSFAYRKLQVDKPTAEWAAKGAKRVLTKLGPLLDGAMECSPVKMPGGVGTGTLSAKEATLDTAPETEAAKPAALVDSKQSTDDLALEHRLARVKRGLGQP